MENRDAEMKRKRREFHDATVQDNDEETGLLSYQNSEDVTYPLTVKNSTAVNARQQQHIRFRISRGIQYLKKPESIFLIVAVLLIIGWITFVCLVKNHHETMKLAAEYQRNNIYEHNSIISLVDIHKKQKNVIEQSSGKPVKVDKDDEDIQHQDLESNSDSYSSTSWGKKAIIKPQRDEKQYKFLLLKNKLKVLLISDPKSTSSTAVLDVRVGSWNEPIAGLSHFLEHMKFLAIRKKGGSSKLEDYLSEHQGSSNAYTSSQNTNYYFTIESTALPGSLEIFSQMFRSQKYSKDFVLREINAVNSEYVNQISNNKWKTKFLLSSIAKKNLPYGNFSCGNNESLLDKNIDILEELQKYEKTHYSSHLMGLTVFSNHTIEQLEDLVQKEHFDAIPQIDFNPPQNFGLPFGKSSLGRLYTIKGDDLTFKELTLVFQIPNDKFNERNDFVAYFNELLKNSSEGGLRYYYIQEGLSPGFAFEKYQRSDDNTIFTFSADLSEKGYENLDLVISGFFSFVKQFKNHIDVENFQKKGNFWHTLFKYDSNEGFDTEDISGLGYLMNRLEKPEELFLQGSYKPFSQDDFENFCEIIGDPMKTIFILKSSSFENVDDSRLLKHVSKNTNGDDNDVDDFDVRVDLYNLDYSLVYNLTKEDAKYFKNSNVTFTTSLDLTLIPTSPEIEFYKGQLEDIENIQEINNIDDQKDNSKSSEELFKSSSEDYAQDPYNSASILNQEKFGFTYDNWQARLSNDSGDISTMPLILAQKQGLKSFYVLDSSQTSFQSQCQMRLVNKNHGFLSKTQLSFSSVYIVTQSRFLEEQYENAIAAKYSLSLYSSLQDLKISFSGWRDNYQNVQSQMINSLVDHIPTSEEWQETGKSIQIALEEQLVNLRVVEKLFQITVLSTLDPQEFVLPEKIELIQQTTQLSQEDIEQQIKQVFQRTELNLLFSGNMSPQEAKDSTDKLDELFPRLEQSNGSNNEDEDELITNSDRIYSVVDFSGKSFIYQELNPNPEDTNSAIVNVYQIGERTIENLIYLQLLEDKLDRFFYEYLRTRKGLGYIANAKGVTIGCVSYITVLLQGDKKQPNEIDQIIETGFEEVHKEIQDLSEEEFQDLMKSFRRNYEKLPSSYVDKLSVMWSQISREMYAFDIYLYILHAIDNIITLKGYQQFFEEKLKTNASKFSFQVFSQATEYDLQDSRNTVNFAQNLQEQENIVISKKEDLVEMNDDRHFKCERIY